MSELNEKRRLVIVHWVDSTRLDGWHFVRDIQAADLRCISVGWVLSESTTSITIIPHRSENSACGIMEIPRKAIIKITNIKEPV